eukprot:6182281-Pyramimonas_sp.AAC.1
MPTQLFTPAKQQARSSPHTLWSSGWASGRKRACQKGHGGPLSSRGGWSKRFSEHGLVGLWATARTLRHCLRSPHPGSGRPPFACLRLPRILQR